MVVAVARARAQAALRSNASTSCGELHVVGRDEIRERLEKRIDLVIEAGACGLEMTTVVDLTGPAPALVRAGSGPLEPLGLA